jgi:TATA-binding protein-associated factor Taf7
LQFGRRKKRKKDSAEENKSSDKTNDADDNEDEEEEDDDDDDVSGEDRLERIRQCVSEKELQLCERNLSKIFLGACRTSSRQSSPVCSARFLVC